LLIWENEASSPEDMEGVRMILVECGWMKSITVLGLHFLDNKVHTATLSHRQLSAAVAVD
jgi:hypothetical protein